MKRKKVTVIGAGFGGLSASALLAKEGFDVTVLEKNGQPGGRASLLKDKGFKFDMGPSWYMMPEVFEKFFSEFNKKPENFYKLKRLEPMYRVFFEDKTTIDITGDLKKDIKTFEKLEPGVTKAFNKYLEESKIKYEVAIDKILYKNMDNVFDLMSLEMARYGSKMGVFEPIDKYASKFFRSKKLKQILEYNLVFLGLSPDKAPALFTLMAHVDFNLGVWYPEGGIYEVVKAMEKIGKEQGVRYKYKEGVKEIITLENQVVSVKTDKASYRADYVISNADYKFTEDILSDQSKRNYSEKYWGKKVLSPSAFLIYLGVKGKLPKLTHHNLYFGQNWKDHFSDVFDNPQWPTNPSMYINKATENDTTIAPKGHEALMILVPVAPDLKENKIWQEKYYDFIIEFVEKNMNLNLKEKIVYKKIFSISDFKNRYNSYKGNALGGIAHTFFQSAVWRPTNKSNKLKNLFFVGAGTAPGIGVPPSIISGHLVRDRLVK